MTTDDSKEQHHQTTKNNSRPSQVAARAHSSAQVASCVPLQAEVAVQASAGRPPLPESQKTQPGCSEQLGQSEYLAGGQHHTQLLQLPLN